jgi:hypothetical protein
MRATITSGQLVDWVSARDDRKMMAALTRDHS